MALVGYSDSEGSETEASSAPKAPAPSRPAKSAVQKLVDSTGPRKIKVELPTAIPDASQPEERPLKRVRTGGGFSGFNALLPAPKRTAETAKKGGLGSGVSLKTSSAAAFSRDPVEPVTVKSADDAPAENNGDNEAIIVQKSADELSKPIEEVKTVGNPMRFRPLSVANKKKKKPIPASAMAGTSTGPVAKAQTTLPATVPTPKPKVSLFSVAQSTAQTEQHIASDTYEPLIAQEETEHQDDDTTYSTSAAIPATHDPNSLSAVASDLNLSAADRRRLFGRGGQSGQPINISNFNMDREYASNEALRAAGEQTQHRAVRAVAPGKHSLQQLVNAASNQKEALEDAWAEGKRNRGEAGNKYGWGR
ncbi:hypothetical protein K461DRAFT_296433 [Myriangium duriaei CBS 260.36]|uniref:Mitotic checkpoint regulator, MAD2B-interacting-domain-containing protein n=1 Tax=Myriangium duriaei CBS 260.36 TaxID=1168546 RepID=A0A9P4MHI4_9PEZI|nr:hypothetical protein K461DRAFT_296433 [Myriangium duriaei CBS 260.36]